MKIEHLKVYDALRDAAEDTHGPSADGIAEVDARAVIEILNAALEDSARQAADAKALRVEFGQIHALIPIDVAPGHPQATRVREALRQAADAQKAARDLREQVATLTTALAKAKADAPEDDRASTYARQIAEAHAQLNACSIPAGRRTLAERCAMIAKGRIADRKARRKSQEEYARIAESQRRADERLGAIRDSLDGYEGDRIEDRIATLIKGIGRNDEAARLCGLIDDANAATRYAEKALREAHGQNIKLTELIRKAERSLKLADAAADELRAQRDLARKREADAGRRIGAMADTIERATEASDEAARAVRAAERDADDLRAKLADILSRVGFA